MSVPLPSPSPLTPSSAKPIPSRSRPETITPGQASPSAAESSVHRITPFSRTPPSPSGSPRSGSLRRHVPNKSISLTGGVNANGNDDNWRERASVGTPQKTAVRTVGGFDKSPKSPSTITSTSPVKEKQELKDNKDANADSKAALSHVPCRFFKAGACTAGANCPFSHEDGAKKEICQWFLKGNCKFGHKCALAHVRPGEPISMDRKNKKAAQLEAREKADGRSPVKPLSGFGHQPGTPGAPESAASPVPIRSALSSSIQSPQSRHPSSPLREPFGPPPPSSGPISPGFARASPHNGVFASSPSRPSPLSSSMTARPPSIPNPLSLKGNVHSPLRPPATTAFSASFSHSSMREFGINSSPVPPLSASFADGSRKNIWARSDADRSPAPSLRAAPASQHKRASHDDVFLDDAGDDLDGDDLAFAVPDSLAELLTPRERARRMSRRDSQDSYSASPSRPAFAQNILQPGGERLAQSAGPTMGPGFLQGLWSAEGGDARKIQSPQKEDFTFGPATAQMALPRQSLLTQQRSPPIPQGGFPSSSKQPVLDASPSPFLIRNLADPASPSLKALQEHAPGQSLPGGFANALSRLHLQGARPGSGLAHATSDGIDLGDGELTPESGSLSKPLTAGKREDHEDEGLFAMES